MKPTWRVLDRGGGGRILGSLSIDDGDGDGNENGEKAIGLGSFPFVRIDRPAHSHRKENFIVNQN